MRREWLANEQDLDQLSSLFRLLADKTRLNIVLKLSGGERNVTHLCEDLSLPQPTVSHHLALLRMSNVVGNRREGKQVYYSLNGHGPMQEDGTLRFDLENFVVRVARGEAKET